MSLPIMPPVHGQLSHLPHPSDPRIEKLEAASIYLTATKLIIPQFTV